jgi:hypothetical protein
MHRATMQMDSIVSSTEEFAVLMKALTDAPKQQKRVHFSAGLSSCSLLPTNNLTREELKSLWYDAQTILNFRTNARKSVFSINTDGQNTNEITRGLESCTFERQLQRHKTTQCILSSCKNGHTPKQTAAMAQKCSEWNRDVALLQACHDFFEVYQPSMPLPDTICQTPPAFPFELKRASSSSSSCQQPPARRVRRRRTV